MQFWRNLKKNPGGVHERVPKGITERICKETGGEISERIIEKISEGIPRKIDKGIPKELIEGNPGRLFKRVLGFFNEVLRGISARILARNCLTNLWKIFFFRKRWRNFRNDPRKFYKVTPWVVGEWIIGRFIEKMPETIFWRKFWRIFEFLMESQKKNSRINLWTIIVRISERFFKRIPRRSFEIVREENSLKCMEVYPIKYCWIFW